MAFDPTFDKVLIEIETPSSHSPGGIILPKQAQEKTFRGVVRAVGPGRWGHKNVRIPVGVHVGDAVMFKQYDGVEFQTEDVPPRNMVVVSEPSILGVIS